MSYNQSCGCQDSDDVVQARRVSVESGLGVTTLLSAESFGTDTLASALTDVQVINRGLVNYAFGGATLVAAASGGFGLAATTALVDFIGADLGSVETSTTVDPTGTASVTQLRFFGLGLGFNIPGLRPEIAHHDVTEIGEITQEINGNLADFDAYVYAEGPDTTTDLVVDTVALEDQFSTVVLSATAAASSEVIFTEIIGTRQNDDIRASMQVDVIFGNDGDDMVRGHAGDDWIFGQHGNDWLMGQLGDDTLFGGEDDDRLAGGGGDDWLFGGDDRDHLLGGAGDDLVMGGEDRDIVRGGRGEDILVGGEDDDIVFGGIGCDVILIGDTCNDGDDIYHGGEGADLFWIVGAFEDDVICDFSLLEGDRLVLDGGMECARITMTRSGCDPDDLTITFRGDGERSTLTLDEFFRYNPELACDARIGNLTSSQTQFILDQIVTEADTPRLQEAQVNLAFAEMLSLLG